MGFPTSDDGTAEGVKVHGLQGVLRDGGEKALILCPLGHCCGSLPHSCAPGMPVVPFLGHKALFENALVLVVDLAGPAQSSKNRVLPQDLKGKRVKRAGIGASSPSYTGS